MKEIKQLFGDKLRHADKPYQLGSFDFGRLVLDEAHALLNRPPRPFEIEAATFYTGTANKECARQVVLGKMDDFRRSRDRIHRERDDMSMLTRVVGVQIEPLFEKILDQIGLAYIWQGRVKHPNVPWLGGIPDIILAGEDALRIISLKSSAFDRDMDMFMPQLEGEIGVLHHAIGGSHDVTGQILFWNLSRSIWEISPVCKYDKGRFSIVYKRLRAYREQFIEYANGRMSEQDLGTRPNSLCGFCSHIENCPAYTGQAVPVFDDPSLVAKATQWEALKATVKDAEKAMGPLKAEFEQILRGLDRELHVRQANLGPLVVQIGAQSRTTVNQQTLKERFPLVHEECLRTTLIEAVTVKSRTTKTKKRKGAASV